MPLDLGPHLDPKLCAVLVFECQEGVIGDRSLLPGLVRAVKAVGLVANVSRLLDSARAAGARVFYCKVAKRPDGIGNPFNTPIEKRLRSRSHASAGGPELGEIVEPLAPRDGDVVVRREHGLTGFYESGLDAFLRNTGVRSIVLTGVSVNIGILGTAIEAVNRGYTAIVPVDCVAGDPPEYAEQALRYAVRNVAFLTTSAEVAAVWST